MFRCDKCGSGYSAQAASSWSSCPRCLARDKISVPLTFERGWRSAGEQREGDGRTSSGPLPTGARG
jgi:hypothetical protein